MVTLASIDFSTWILLLFYPLIRIMALVATAPLFGEKEVGAKVKIGLALLITILLSPIQQHEYIAIFSPQGVWVIIQQVIIGITLGFTMQLAFATVRLSGEVIGMQMGLSFATFYDPSGGPNMPVLARIFNVLTLLLFLSFDGHLWMLSALANSFEILPISTSPLRGEGFLTLVQASSMLFINGLMLALPLITLLLTLSLALGILNRITPQLSIFVVGFPLTLSIGIITLSLLMPLLTPYSERLFTYFFGQLSDIMLRLAPL